MVDNSVHSVNNRLVRTQIVHPKTAIFGAAALVWLAFLLLYPPSYPQHVDNFVDIKFRVERELF